MNRSRCEDVGTPLPGNGNFLGTGALSYDLFPGAVTLDDAYKTSPFGNWYYKASPAAPLNGSVLTALVAALNNVDEKERSGRMPREEAPRTEHSPFQGQKFT